MPLVQELRSWVWFSGYEFCRAGQGSQKVKLMSGQQPIAIGKPHTSLPVLLAAKPSVGGPRPVEDTMQRSGSPDKCGCFNQSMKFTRGSLQLSAASEAWSKTRWPQYKAFPCFPFGRLWVSALVLKFWNDDKISSSHLWLSLFLQPVSTDISCVFLFCTVASTLNPDIFVPRNIN